MGVCCATREKDRDSDLQAPELAGNVFQKFEKSLPFSRTYVDTVAKRVRQAAESCKEEGKGDGSTVTLEALRKVFLTPAWADLKKEDSRITKLINHAVFANGGGNIDVNSLILFAILNSPGSVEYKSEVLYSVLQEGGVEKQKFMTAGDKDIPPVIAKLIKLVSVDLIQLIQDLDGDHPMDLEDKAEEIDYATDELLEENYLEPIYGTASRLSYEEWKAASLKVKSICEVWYVP